MSKSAANLPRSDDPAVLMRKRQYRLALALMIVGSALGWWAVASPWITVEESLLGAVTNADIAATTLRGVSGASLSPLASAMPILGAAGVVGVIGSRGLLRRAIGVLVLLSGAALAWLAFDAMRTWSVGFDLSGSEKIVAMSTVYPLAAILAGVLLAAGGFLAFARGAEWTVLGKNYEQAGRTPRDAWESLDMGVDPTVDGE